MEGRGEDGRRDWLRWRHRDSECERPVSWKGVGASLEIVVRLAAVETLTLRVRGASLMLLYTSHASYD